MENMVPVVSYDTNFLLISEMQMDKSNYEL